MGLMSEQEFISTEQVTVTRSPRYARFLVLGIAVGILAAIALTVGLPNDSKFTLLQIFGFLALITCAIGGTLGLVVALIFERVYRRRAQAATAERITSTVVRDESDGN
jgi:NhaP-type Na+/H+ or K+/H+ antiporter